MITDQDRADTLYDLADEIMIAGRDEMLSRAATEAISGLAESYRKVAKIYGERSCKYCHRHPGQGHTLECINSGVRFR